MWTKTTMKSPAEGCHASKVEFCMIHVQKCFVSVLLSFIFFLSFLRQTRMLSQREHQGKWIYTDKPDPAGFYLPNKIMQKTKCMQILKNPMDFMFYFTSLFKACLLIANICSWMSHCLCPGLVPVSPGVCKLLSLVMSETESPTYREEDYRFLHSMLMEKKVHLLFKVQTPLQLSATISFIFFTKVVKRGTQSSRTVRSRST